MLRIRKSNGQGQYDRSKAKPNSGMFPKGYKSQSGKFASDSANWKGGRVITTGGYIEVYNLTHPYASHGHVLEHRLVMEEYLGRYLQPNEIVHHINHIRTDNRLENLQLMSRREHHNEHYIGRKHRQDTKDKIREKSILFAQTRIRDEKGRFVCI